ncbi:MAG: SUMF1/EgtB/PvdO family nonheme iron enzyme [Planctomycetota bacterium]|jgi:hypothetical protein|nr:SUMF1/EgtB/PvdO family nonheme iron enzyme [Planctomycetota bacterium]
MPIEIQCANPQCAQGMAAPDEQAGRQVACPACGFVNNVPAKQVYAQAVRVEPAQTTADKVRSRRGRSQSKSKAVPVMLLLLLACGGGGYFYMTQNPAAPPDPKPTEVPTTPKPEPKAGSSAQDQLFSELQELDRFAARNKRKPARAIQKYEAFLKKSPNEILAKRARLKMEELKSHLNKDAQAEIYRRKKRTAELLKDWRLTQALSIWKDFPPKHAPKVQDQIDSQIGIIGQQSNEYAAHLETKIKKTMRKSPFDLSDEEKEQLQITIGHAEKIRDRFKGTFLEPTQELKLTSLVRTIEKKLDSTAVDADQEQSSRRLKEMWGALSKTAKERNFEAAMDQLKEQQLAIGKDLYFRLKKDVEVLQTAFETAYGRIDRLVGKTTRLNGRPVKIGEVRDGKLYYIGKETEKAYEPSLLELGEIIKLCKEDPPTDDTVYRETLFSIYFGSAAGARNAILKARKSGFSWKPYEWRVIPAIIIKTVPSGASVSVKPGKSDTLMRTPLRLEGEHRKTYTFEISKQGYFPQTTRVKTQTGGQTVVDLKLEKTYLPEWMARDFEVPLELKDLYGNPVSRGRGYKLDFPKEIRSKKSGTYLVLVPRFPQFYLGKYEITLREWAYYVKKSGVRTSAEEQGHSKVYDGRSWLIKKGANWRRPGIKQNTSSHPVLHLSSKDIIKYADWIRTEKGHFRIPTYHEWEFACQGGTGAHDYYWEGGTKAAGKHANVADMSFKKSLLSVRNKNVFETKDYAVFTRDVGKYMPNGYGLYDMIGNVWEKCRSLPDQKYYSNYSRGGAWDTGPSLATIIPIKKSYSYTDRFYRAKTNDTSGGRLLFDLKEPEPVPFE